ncbi:MAG: heterodisulfide reductase-related iron-sulfur binding cluster [Polyangiaceae bacterium]
MSKIPRKPSEAPATGPVDPRYFDERDLESELRRTFQICHECRMCVGYCGSFPELFKRVDRDIESGRAEGAELLAAADFKVVVDECWQCKLCFVKCPYTKDDGASELLDFPRLMARAKAVEAKRNGVAFVDKILGEPQMVGSMGSGFAAGMTNLVHASRLVRKVQEKVAGISSEFPIPPMAAETFPSWFASHTKVERSGEAGEVVLFATCYGDYNAPNVPIAAVRVLEHNGWRVVLPGPPGASATCCGMPNLDGGDVESFKRKIEYNVGLLYEQAARGLKIVVPSPTCSYTMKREWPEYLPTKEVKTVAAATMDLMEFIVDLGKKKQLDLKFKNELGNLAYHVPCHLRAQKIGVPGQRVLSKVPGTDVRVIEECSAVDGTWGMKAEHYATGRRYAQKLVRGVTEAEPDLVVTDCTLSALRIAHEVRDPDDKPTRVVHPIEALAEAYDLGEATGARGIVPT